MKFVTRARLQSLFTPVAAASLALALCAEAAPGQVIQVSGGASTLDQARGGQVTIRGRNYAGNLGGGFIDGRFYAGGRVTRQFEHARVSLGTEQIDFDLPTDVFERGHYLTGVGLGLSTESDTLRTFVFAGATAGGFNTPFFNAVDAENPALLARVASRTGNAEASGAVLLSNALTILGSLQWKSDSADTQIAATAGLGASKLYSAASLSIHRALFDLDAEYVMTSPNFRRALVRTPLNSEPYRENVQLIARLMPMLVLTVSRENFLTPVYGSDQNTTSQVNQATANLQLVGTNLAATVSDSSDGTRSNLASFAAASRNFGERTEIEAAYLVSRPSLAQTSSAFVSTVRQTLNPRWTVSGVANVSNGQATLGAGGTFLSNLATLSLDYQEFYVPARVADPFERALIANIQVHLFGRVTATATSFVGPDGRVLYTGGGSGLIARNAFADVPVPAPHNSIGRVTLRGRVMTVMGEPVAGAALLVDHLVVYTDSRGLFEVRERKSRAHSLSVECDSFLEGGTYETVSAPAIAWSTANGNAGQEEMFVVRRVLRVKEPGKGGS